jgi:chromosome segregation ATPase
MAEGSETPSGEQGMGPEGRGRRSEGDLFSERRARRAAESGEIALTRRAEAAEATVQTLERHVASLQQRLSEAEGEHARLGELIEAERAVALEREHELRRVKQREYAEQQLRVEAEDRLLVADRESRVELERLSSRLGASERDARELALRLDSVQRQLAETEQAGAAERAAVRAQVRAVADQNLQERIAALERRAAEIQAGLQDERAARERSERLLEDMREGHRRMEALVGEMKGIVASVSSALASDSHELPPAKQPLPAEQRGAEMADALAAAVERLRARAEAVPPVLSETPAEASGQVAQSSLPPVAQSPPQPAVQAPAQPPAYEPQRPQPGAQSPMATPLERAPHKHSLSWIERQRIRRKQRRGR